MTRQKDLAPVYMEGRCKACGTHTIVHKDTRLCAHKGCIDARNALADVQRGTQQN